MSLVENTPSKELCESLHSLLRAVRGHKSSRRLDHGGCVAAEHLLLRESVHLGLIKGVGDTRQGCVMAPTVTWTPRLCNWVLKSSNSL